MAPRRERLACRARPYPSPCNAVRIVSSAQLVREGGERELRIADAELMGGTSRTGGSSGTKRPMMPDD